MKRLGRALSLFLALILLCTSLFGCAAVVRPLNYLKSVLEKTVEKRFGGEMLEVLLETLESGSVAVTYGGTDLYDTPLDNGEAKIYFDREGRSLVAIGNATVKGQKYDGKVFFSNDELVLCSTAFFGSNDLGVNFSTLEKDLRGSIFANHSGNKYARPEIGEDAASDAIALKDSIFALYDSYGDLLELSDEVAETFLKILTEYAPHSRYSEKGTLYIEAVVDNTVLSRALRDTRAKIVKDSGFRRELRELAAIKDRFASVESGFEITEYSDKVEEFIASDIGINELCNRIDAAPVFQVKLNAAVDRSARLLETASLSYTVSGEQIFVLAVDLTDDDTNELSLTYGGAVRTLCYQVCKNGINRYEAELSYRKTAMDGTELLLVTGELLANRREDSFTLSLQKGEETRVFAGTFDKKIDGFEVSVDTVFVNGAEHRFALSLAVKTKDKAEKMPVYTNLATITEAQFDPIYTRAVAAQNALKAAFAQTDIDAHAALSYFLTVAGVQEEIPERQETK